MCRLSILSIAIIFVIAISRNCHVGSVLPRTKLLYAQAFSDGFWRGLSGDLAVVTYHPVRKGKHVYYYQVPYYSVAKPGYSHSHGHGYRSHGFGHSVHGHGGIGHGNGGFGGIGTYAYGYPSYSHGYSNSYHHY